MNDWLPNYTEHKPTAFTVTIFQPTISFHKERKYGLGLNLFFTIFNIYLILVLIKTITVLTRCCTT